MTASPAFAGDEARRLSADSLIEISNATVRYGKAVALKDLTLTLYPRESVAVVGPNGAGKSTLLKLIAGEVRQSGGRVALCNCDEAAHHAIAYVPQHKSVDWSFPVTVQDVVMMGRIGRIGLLRRTRKKDRDLVQHSLEEVGMAALADKRIGALSGGQQQRVFIARAIAQQASILLLDEPLAGLDIPSQQKFLEILNDIRANGVTPVMATHDLSLAKTAFDRAVLLNRHLVAAGEPEGVLSAENLRHAYSNHLYAMELMSA